MCLVLINQEPAFNGRWVDIAFKIDRFIKCQMKKEQVLPLRVTDANYPFSNVVEESKWQPRDLRSGEVKSKGSNIEVTAAGNVVDIHENGLLKRCLVGYCSEETKERPTPADIRIWSSAN